MSSTVPKKDFLNFLSDYHFGTKSPVAFTSPLALYREDKTRYPSLTFHQVKTWLQSKTPTPFINQFGIIFLETVSSLPGLMISGKQIWSTLALWHILTRDTNFYSPASMYFQNLLRSYHLKTSRENLYITVFSQS